NAPEHISAATHFWGCYTGGVQLQAPVDGKKVIITESTVRRDLQLEDAEGVDCLPNDVIFKQLTLMGKPRRKVTGVPQPSDSTEHVTDEAINEEMDDSLVRAATTASSLEAKQDSGNINKTQCKATPNKLGSQGTSSGGGRFNDQEDAEMLFDVADDLRGKEVFVSQEVPLKEVSAVDEVNAVRTATTTTATIDDITLAKALMEIKSAKPKADKVMIQEPEHGTTITTLTTTTAATTITTASTRPKAKGLIIHEHEQEESSLQQKQQKKRGTNHQHKLNKKNMCTYLKNMEGKKLKDLKNKSFDSIQKKFDKAFKRVNTFIDYKTELVVESSIEAEEEVTDGSSKRAGEELKQENAKKQKMEDDKESEELKQCLEIIPEDGDDVTIDATPLSSKSPTIVDYKNHKEGKKSYF
nr:hypothetical protein [Tanacetum cinerariifolium]